MIVGATFGAGNSTTTFNVPDLRGRAAGGKGDMGVSAASRLTNTGVGNPDVDGAALGAVGGRYIANACGSVFNLNNAPNTAVTGGGQAHTNVQPTMVLNHLIKT